MIGRNEEVQVGGGNRFNGLEVQTAESNANAVNMMGFARAPDCGDVDARQRRDRPRHQEALRQQLVEPDAAQRSVAVPAARRAGTWFHDRPAPRLPHADDRPEKINYEKMEKIARLIHQVSWNLAQQEDKPELTRGEKR